MSEIIDLEQRLTDLRTDIQSWPIDAEREGEAEVCLANREVDWHKPNWRPYDVMEAGIGSRDGFREPVLEIWNWGSDIVETDKLEADQNAKIVTVKLLRGMGLVAVKYGVPTIKNYASSTFELETMKDAFGGSALFYEDTPDSFLDMRDLALPMSYQDAFSSLNRRSELIRSGLSDDDTSSGIRIFANVRNFVPLESDQPESWRHGYDNPVDIVKESRGE